MADHPTLFTGSDLLYYEDSIRKIVEQRNRFDGGNLMKYFGEERSSSIKAKVLSAIPSVEIRNGELMGCTTVRLKEMLTDREMTDLNSYLLGQFSDGWGEGLEQQEIQTGDGILFVHFGEAEPFAFEVEQVDQTVPAKEQAPVSKRPKMKLAGQDGNIFSILGRASRLLRENGQQKQVTEMTDRVYRSTSYPEALSIISEYVETEISCGRQSNMKNRSGPER